MCRPHYLYSYVERKRIRRSVEFACAHPVDDCGAADQKSRGGRQQWVDRIAGSLQNSKQAQHDDTRYQQRIAHPRGQHVDPYICLYLVLPILPGRAPTTRARRVPLAPL